MRCLETAFPFASLLIPSLLTGVRSCSVVSTLPPHQTDRQTDRQLFFELYVKTHTQTLTHDSHRPRGKVVDKTGTTAYSARSSEPIPPMDTPDTGGHTTHRDYASDNFSRWSVSGAPPKRCPSRFEDLGLATLPQRGVPAHWARQGVASSCAFSHGLWDEAALL